MQPAGGPERQDASSQRFAQEAEQTPPGLLPEFVQFLRHNKKWWLAPIIITLLLIGALVVLSVSPGGLLTYPFI